MSPHGVHGNPWVSVKCPITHFSQKPFCVIDFAGFSSPRTLKLSMSVCWASMPETGAVSLLSTLAHPEPSFTVLYTTHDFNGGICGHFSECEIKLLDGGCFKVSLLYFVHFGVLGEHLNVLRKPSKKYATDFGMILVLTNNNCNPTSTQVHL